MARCVSRYYDEALDPVGLRSTQFVLLALVGTDDGIGLRVLADAADLDRSTVTRNLRPLERNGWLRVRSAGPGRPSHAFLTAKGKRQLARAVPIWKRAQGRFEQAVGKRAWKGLLPELARLRGEVTELSEPA